MTYLNTDIYTKEHCNGLYVIEINDYENDELINLDITEKELEILYDVIRRIREYNIFPRTKIYLNEYIDNIDCEIWDDEDE